MSGGTVALSLACLPTIPLGQSRVFASFATKSAAAMIVDAVPSNALDIIFTANILVFFAIPKVRPPKIPATCVPWPLFKENKNQYHSFPGQEVTYM